VAAAAGAVAWFILAAPPAPPVAPPPRAGGETRPQGAIILGLLRLPAVRILLAISVCIFAFNHALNNWLPEVLRGHGMTPAAAGYWATIPTVVGIAGSLLVPRLATPPRRGAILLALALCATASTVLLQSDAGTLLAAGLVAQGIARSALMTIALLALVETRGVGERYAGTAGGLFFSAAEVGGAGGPILFGVLHDATGGYAASLAMLTGLTILMLLCLARLRAVSTAPDPA
jgi:cyanate permease